MENNVNQKTNEKVVKNFEKKEQITHSLPSKGLIFIGIAAMVILVSWLVLFLIKNEVSTDLEVCLISTRPLEYAIIIGIIVLIYILSCCANTLGIIARNQMEIMEHLDSSPNKGFEKNEDTQSTSNSEQTSNSRAEKVVRLLELREANLITEEEYNDQLSKL